MKILNGISELEQALAMSVVTIGNFDGLHKGHQALIHRLLEESRTHEAPSVVFTFHPHPVQVLRPEIGLRRLFDTRDLAKQLESRGVDYLILEPFSREFSQRSPQDFMENWIGKFLNPKVLIVGHDFAFGANRQGSIETLEKFSQKLGFKLDVVEPVRSESELVSSSRIRSALEVGEVSLATELLGRPFYIEGVVEKGDGRGKSLGFPTANIRLFSETIPAPGVYATSVLLDGTCYPSVTNIGNNPTFYKKGPQAPLRIETYVIDQNFDIYGRELQIHFISRIRNEMKFDGPEALRQQISKDIETARKIHEGLKT